MGRRNRRLLVPLMATTVHMDRFADQQAAQFAVCPEAAQYSDEEAEEFLAAACHFDQKDRESLAAAFKRAELPLPLDLAFDEYRLGRYLFRQWRDPAVRTAWLEHGMRTNFDLAFRLKRKGSIKEILKAVDTFSAPVIFTLLRLQGGGDLIAQAVAAFSPDQAMMYNAWLQYGKMTLHRYLTEPEPVRRRTRWDVEKIARRIHLREVQLRSLRGSIHALRGERRALLARLRAVSQQEQPELHTLAAELEQLRLQRAEAVRRHGLELERRRQAHQEEMARLQAELARSRQEFAETLALRVAWLPAPRGEA